MPLIRVRRDEVALAKRVEDPQLIPWDLDVHVELGPGTCRREMLQCLFE